MTRARIGVLGLQGASQEHVASFKRIGVEALVVKTVEQFEIVDALVIPGGESTTISMLLESSGLAKPVADAIRAEMPVFGTCAGMILLATEVADGRADQLKFAAIDLRVQRNGFGRQAASFETFLDNHTLGGGPLEAVFIRAPKVERAGSGVEVLASLNTSAGDEHPVLCRQGNVLVSAYHPELCSSTRVHRLFLEMVETATASAS